MFGIDVPARALVIPAALVGCLGATLLLRHDAGKVIVKSVTPKVAVAAAPAPVEVEAPIKPTFDLVAELRAIGRAAVPAFPTTEDHPGIQALGTCKRATARETAKLQNELATWVDHTYTDEVANAVEGLELTVGCDEPNGWIVNAHADRKTKGVEHSSQSRWWMLRVNGDDITVLAERTATAVDNWMEWADEGTLGAEVLIDLDHDGVRDVVWMKTAHEGGASRSDYTLLATLSKTGTTTQILEMTGRLDLQISGTDVVLALGPSYDDVTYRCIGPDLKLTECPAATRIRTRNELAQLASRYVEMTASTVPDADLLAEQLAKLGVPAVKRAALIAAAPETHAGVRVQRQVAAFVAKARPEDHLATVTGLPHDQATAYFSDLRSQLGDAPCVPSTLSEGDTRRLNAWIAAQPSAVKGKHEPAAQIAPACGSYVWAMWEDWTAGRDSNAGVRHETLVSLGDDVTRVVAFDFPATGDPQMGPPTAHTSTFFRHGDTIVGEVVHLMDDHTELLAIANARVVAKRKGAFELYTYDSRWTDTSDDLIAEGTSAWWHATPTGLERIDSEVLQPHEARRAAFTLLENYTPGDTLQTADYVRALKTLGAPTSLVRAVRGL